MAVALRLAYAPSSQDAAFSLDPAGPSNPIGPWLQKVYYPKETLQGTAFGRALYEADWVLKQYSFGVVVKQGKEPRTRISTVPEYRSVAELSFANSDLADRREKMSRFWIVSGEMRIRRDGSCIVFDRATMRVKTKRQVPDRASKSGLRDDNSIRDPIDEEFARRFTDHYDELAAEAPGLERVRELAKAVALAKWLRQNNVAVDLASMGLAGDGLQTEDPDADKVVPALSTMFERRQLAPIREGNRQGILTTIHQIHLFGGVDLSLDPEYVYARNLVELRKAVQERIRLGNETRFRLIIGDQELTATVLPITPGSIEQQARLRTYLRNGLLYRLNPQGQVVESVDRSGDRAVYRYGNDGGLVSTEMAGKNGWKAVGSRVAHGSLWQITTARGNQFDVLSGPSGDISSINVDGKPWAKYTPQRNGVSVTYSQGRFTQTLIYDRQRRLTHYRLERSSSGAKASRRKTYKWSTTKPDYPVG